MLTGIGVVKAPPDHYSGSQLQLDVQPGDVPSEIDLHHVPLIARRLAQVDDFHSFPLLEPGDYQVPCGGVGEVRV